MYRRSGRYSHDKSAAIADLAADQSLKHVKRAAITKFVAKHAMWDDDPRRDEEDFRKMAECAAVHLALHRKTGEIVASARDGDWYGLTALRLLAYTHSREDVCYKVVKVCDFGRLSLIASRVLGESCNRCHSNRRVQYPWRLWLNDDGVCFVCEYKEAANTRRVWFRELPRLIKRVQASARGAA